MLAKDVKYVQLEKVLRTRLRLQLCRVIRVAAAYDGRLFKQTRVDKEALARSRERSARHTADFRVQTEGVRDALGGASVAREPVANTTRRARRNTRSIIKSHGADHSGLEIYFQRGKCGLTQYESKCGLMQYCSVLSLARRVGLQVFVGRVSRERAERRGVW